MFSDCLERVNSLKTETINPYSLIRKTKFSFLIIYEQALQLGQDPHSLYGLRSQRCQMCLPSDSLHKVMERLAIPGSGSLQFPLLFIGSQS